MYAYAHTPLDEETIKHTSFSSGDKLFVSYEVFMVLKDFQFLSLNECQLSLKLL